MPGDHDSNATPGSRRRSDDAAGPVEEGFEEVDTVDDPEGAPTLPSAGLIAGAVRGLVLGRRHGAGGIGREIVALSWPVMLSQVLVTIVGLIDVAMVGRLSPDALAAVGYATQFYFLAQSTLIAVGFACVALMSRAIGAGRKVDARRSLAASVLVAFVVAAMLAAMVLVAPRTLLGFLNAEPRVVELTLPYMRLLFASSLLLAVALTLENALRADRNTVTPMRIAALVTATKIGANFLLIFGFFGLPRLELVGAGLATILSQVVAVVAFARAIARAPAGSPLAVRRSDWRPALGYVRDVVRIALPGVGERLILNMALLAYFAILGRYGTVAIAAYTIGVRILAFSWIPGTGYGAATATLVGQALGAGEPDRAEQIGWQGARIALLTAVALGSVFAVAHEPLGHLFTDDVAIVATLGPFMLILAIAQPLLQVHFTLGGAHRGAGDTWTPLLAATIGNWAFRVPLACLAALWFESSLVWVWSALVVDHLARAVWLGFAFRRGAWKTRMPPARR
jgi:putative MATE family efflux protein